MERLDLRVDARAHALAVDVPGMLMPAVIATWRGRMINEYGSARVFAGLAGQLARLGHDHDAATCDRFAAEERSHGVLCGAVVEAAGGTAMAEVSAARAVPMHGDTSLRAAVMRNVISICCLSETVAVALIGAERLEMPEGPLRQLLSRILADEIGHARFGWVDVARRLPALDADERAAIDRYLPTAFAALERHELAHLPVATAWPAAAAAYGLCDGDDARALFVDTVTEVIIPQLEAHGLSAARAWQDRRLA